jgi:metal-dependent amidase/aminoacylase/carboxypeptidase family protein
VVEAEVTERTPVLVNGGPPLALARQAALDVVGPARVLPLRSRNMGGEDFAWYLSRVPGAYVRFGARVDGRSHAAHSTRFEFHEDALGVGEAWYDRVARIGR